MKSVRIGLLFASLVVLGTATLLAQSTTSGSLQGTVSDADGGVLPGVTITVKSSALVSGRLMAITDERGLYRFPSLPPGGYALEAELSAFNTTRRDGLRIQLGQAISVDLRLELATMTEQITVTAETPLVSVVTNTVSSNLDQSFLDSQPLPRNLTALMSYAPGVNSTDENRAYGGTQGRENAYTLDGVNVSDPAGGDSWIFPSVDWLQEVQVGGLGGNAEYGGYTAGVLNAVTKSGGNELQGSVIAYYTPDSFVSNNSDSADKPTNTYSDFSASIGGAVTRDKLWYFVSANVVKDDRTPVGALAADSRSLTRGLAKLTWQQGLQNRLVVLADYDGIIREHRNVSALTLPSGTPKQESPNVSYNVTWEGLLDASNFVTAKLTGFNGRDDRLPYGDSNQPGREDAFSGLIWDNYKWTVKQEVERQTLDVAWSIFADALLTKADSHAFKLGGVYERGKARQHWTRNGGFSYYDDSYYCDSEQQYLADPACGIYSADFGNEINMFAEQSGLAFYAQDSMKLGRLNVNYGVRYTQYKGGFENSRSDVYSVDFVDPRLGLVVDLSGNSRTALKAHYGRYHQGMFSYLYDREASGQVYSPSYYCDYSSDTEEFDTCSTPVTSAARMSSNIRHPYTDQYVATLEQQLGTSLAVGLDYVVRRTRDVVAMVNANDDYDSQVAPGNPFGGGSLPFYDLQSDNDFLLTNPNGAYRDYDAWMLRLDKRYANGWLLRASVVRANLKGNAYSADGYVDEWQDKNGQTNADGQLPGTSQWEVKLDTSVDLPAGFQASASYRFFSGERWTPYATVRGLYYNDPQTVYLEKRGSEQLPDRSLVDMRVSWTTKLGATSNLSVFLDGFNVLNSSTTIGVNSRWGNYRYSYDNHPAGSTWQPSSAFKTATAVERPRTLRLGMRLAF